MFMMKAGFCVGSRPHRTTSGPRLLTSRWPSPRVRNADLEVTWFRITPGHTGTRHLRYPTDKSQEPLVTACTVKRALLRKTSSSHTGWRGALAVRAAPPTRPGAYERGLPPGVSAAVAIVWRVAGDDAHGEIVLREAPGAIVVSGPPLVHHRPGWPGRRVLRAAKPQEP